MRSVGVAPCQTRSQVYSMAFSSQGHGIRKDFVLPDGDGDTPLSPADIPGPAKRFKTASDSVRNGVPEKGAEDNGNEGYPRSRCPLFVPGRTRGIAPPVPPFAPPSRLPRSTLTKRYSPLLFSPPCPAHPAPPSPVRSRSFALPLHPCPILQENV